MQIQNTIGDESIGNKKRARENRSLVAATRATAARGLTTLRERTQPRDVARGLGWVSIGLGVAQLTATAALSRGVLGANRPRYRAIMRAVGVRELVAGLGLLAQPRSPAWSRMRVAGDLVDLALLGLAATSRRTKARHLSLAAAAVIGIGAVDLLTSRHVARETRDRGLTRRGALSKERLRVTRSITIARPRDDVYRFWRDLENLPRFMTMLASIDVRDDRHSHWHLRGPAKQTLDWESEITEDRPNERIAWRTTGETALPNTGEVIFKAAPGNRGTEVTLDIEYRPPGGVFGKAFAKLFAKAPEIQLWNDLRRCKQILEMGEVMHSNASVAEGKHPARPLAQERSNQSSRSANGGER